MAMMVIAAAVCALLAGCSTIDTRIQKNPTAYAHLSASDQALVRAGRIRDGMPKSAVFLAWGRPDQLRRGFRRGAPYEAWIYTEQRPQFTSFGGYGGPYFSRFGFYGYNGYWGGFPYGGPFGGPWGDDIVYQEVPYKTAFFENERCTGYEYIRY